MCTVIRSTCMLMLFTALYRTNCNNNYYTCIPHTCTYLCTHEYSDCLMHIMWGSLRLIPFIYLCRVGYFRTEAVSGRPELNCIYAVNGTTHRIYSNRSHTPNNRHPQLEQSAGASSINWVWPQPQLVWQ